MAGEEWARHIVAKELKRAVELNDDGSVPSMYDLRIGPFDAPEVAIECVGAINSAFTETWNNSVETATYIIIGLFGLFYVILLLVSAGMLLGRW